MTTDLAIPPPVTWAQRRGIIFLTICVEDCKNPVVRIEADKIYFAGTGGAEKKEFEVTIELYKEIDSEKSRHFVRDRLIEFILAKKEEGPYWPHLMKQKLKYHWLKIDFIKWEDENDSDEEDKHGGYFEDYAKKVLLGDGEGDSPDFKMGERKPDLDDLSDYDSDDEDLPDLE